MSTNIFKFEKGKYNLYLNIYRYVAERNINYLRHRYQPRE